MLLPIVLIVATIPTGKRRSLASGRVKKKYYASSSSADLIYDSALPPLYCLGLEARDVKKIRGWVTFVNVITWIVILPVVICGFILFGSGKILMAISTVLGAFVVLRVICSTVLIGIVYWLFG